MRNFLKTTLASLIGSLAGLLLFFAIGAGGLVFLLMAASRDTAVQVRNKSVLVFDLSVGITDSDPTRSTSEALGQVLSGDEPSAMTLRTVLNTLDQAIQDPKIIALYLDGSKGLGASGYATLKEVRAKLERFRATGKKIIAYDADMGERELYISSVANTSILSPIGALEINGISSEQMFYTGALQKYGIDVQVIRVGKYKSAVEPFLLKKLSPENRQQTQNFLGDIWGDLLTTVGKSRGVNPKQLQAIADNVGVLQPEDAKKRRLVDRVAYLDEVVTDLKKLTDSDKDDRSFRQVDLREYANVEKNERHSKNRIAVVYAEGEIVNGQGGGEQVGGDRLARQLRQIRLNDNVKAVVLRVNSPGGSVTASEVIEREVRLTRQAKPVIVSMGNYAASGGYWISAYADRIFAEPNTITGSIGVFGFLPNIKKIANNNGVTWDGVKTGRLADSQTFTRPKTPQEMALAQKSVNQIYYQFINKVSQARKLPLKRVAEIAQGRVWSGQDARQLGLVDELGGLEKSIQYAATAAKLGDDWEIREYPESRSLEERIFGSFGAKIKASQVKSDPLTAEFLKIQEELAILKALNDPKSIYARLPVNLRID